MFDVKTATESCIQWIKDWFENNSSCGNAVVGISGGVDSSVVAALCVRALGKDRVYGLMMPEGTQVDGDACLLCECLGIRYFRIDIFTAVNDIKDRVCQAIGRPTSIQTEVNLPARIRMATLYAVSQSMNGRVASTCNLSEDWVGYNTRWGDSVGDFAPLSCFTKTEVRAIGNYLKLPKELVEAVPADGLCGMTDEENFGFTYDVLDEYIRTGRCEDKKVKDKIDFLHEKNKFKMEPMARFEFTSVENELSCDDIKEISRSVIFPDGKVKTSVKFRNGTETSVIFNKENSIGNEEKAIRWCLSIKENMEDK